MPNDFAPAARASQPYEPGRLRRASRLAVKRLGDGHFAVRGQTEQVYYVDLMGDPPCTCLDAFHRSATVGPCKHLLAAKLASGDLALLQALGDMLLKAEKALAEHTRRTRRTPGCQRKR